MRIAQIQRWSHWKVPYHMDRRLAKVLALCCSILLCKWCTKIYPFFNARLLRSSKNSWLMRLSFGSLCLTAHDFINYIHTYLISGEHRAYTFAYSSTYTDWSRLIETDVCRVHKTLLCTCWRIQNLSIMFLLRKPCFTILHTFYLNSAW